MIVTNPMTNDPRVYKEAKYYVMQGHEVEILCWDRENEAEVDEVREGIKLHRFHIYAKYASGFKNQIKAYLQFRKECVKYLKNQKFDILHCHDLDGAVVGLAVKNNVTKVFDMHEYYLTKGSKLLNRVFAFLVQTVQNKFNYIIYLNDTQKADVQAKNTKKLLYLPNYPEKKLFVDIEKNKSNMIRIGYAGFIRCEKAFVNLFKTVKGTQNIRIDLYGEGCTVEKLLPYANDKIALHGKYNYNDAEKIYKDIDIVNCVYDTLENDGYPIKFFESMVTKTPVIADKNSIIAEVVKKYDIGFLVDVNDIYTYKVLMQQLNDNPQIVEQKVKNFDSVNMDICWEDVAKCLDIICEK